jgi:LysM repeat protein
MDRRPPPTSTPSVRKRRGQLRPIKPAGSPLTFQFNPRLVQRIGGGGSWSVIRRPKARPATEWDGASERRLVFTLIFDGYAAGRVTSSGPGVVETDCRRLEELWDPSGDRRPAQVKFDYGPVGAGRTWVIDDLSHGDELLNAALERVYSEISVTLLEYVEPEVTLVPSVKYRSTQTDVVASTRNYSVRAGESLASIAAARLGSASRWTELAQINGIRDPRSLKAGQTIRVPVV